MSVNLASNITILKWYSRADQSSKEHFTFLSDFPAVLLHIACYFNSRDGVDQWEAWLSNSQSNIYNTKNLQATNLADAQREAEVLYLGEKEKTSV